MATITAAAGGGNWNVGSTWVGGVVPLTTDDVVLDATSGQVTITATAQCKDINFSGYTNTITFNANLTITGNLTRSASVFSYAGTLGIIIAGTTTQIITTSSVAWTIPVNIGGVSPSISINDAFNITAPLTLSSTTSPVIARANVFDLTENVNPSGNITISSNGTYTGSANIVVSGSNNQTLTASGNHQIRNNLTINKTGGVLTLSGTLNYNTGTLSYIASGGTVNAGSSTLNIGASTTLDTNGITWNSISYSGGTTTITLSSNLVFTGTFTITGSSTTTVTLAGVGIIDSINGTLQLLVSGGNLNITTSATHNILNYQFNALGFAVNISGTWNVYGNVIRTGIGNGRVATGTINFVGTGSVLFNGGATGGLIGNWNINTSGTITFGSVTFPNVFYEQATLTYTAGTVVTNNCTLYIGLTVSGITTTLNTSGMAWQNIILVGNNTLALTSDLNINGNLTTQTTANMVINGLFNVNLKGNLAINTTTTGTSTIIFNGTGSQSWTHGSAVYISNPITINKASGTLTLGSAAYVSGGTFTYTQGDVDVTTNNNTLFVVGGTYNVENLKFNTFYYATSGVSVITLASNLYARTFTCGGNSTINGAFDIYCSYFNMNNSSTGQISASLAFPRTIYCNIDATFSGATATNVCTFSGSLYVGGSCYHNAPSTSNQGAANLYMVGNGELRAPSTAGTFISNLYFNTSGKITITGNISYAFGAARTINLIRGNIDARKATLTLNRAFTHSLTNMNKMVWGNVVLDTVSAQTLNMNEFFCGDATTQTNITASTTTNAIVTFTDNFEKIAKFVKINGITFTRPQQLLLLTNQPKKTRNIGIRYNNSLANGVAKNDPSVQNQMAYSVPKYLVGDPNMIKSI